MRPNLAPTSTDSTNPQSCVLLLQPDALLAQSITVDLQTAGYRTVTAADPTQGLALTGQLSPVMVVVDRTTGGDASLRFCKTLRQQGMRIPLLLLMAREQVDDRMACLDSGADDYLLKPYRSDEFLKLVRFYLKTEVTEQEQLRFADLVLDLGLRQVLRNGRSIDLTLKEFELLKFLMEHPREVLSREQILENVWGSEFMGESNVIEVYIRYLRLKIEEEGDRRLIQTVRGIGYVLREA
jgi:two-component system, OmpR family, response regulator NblR